LPCFLNAPAIDAGQSGMMPVALFSCQHGSIERLPDRINQA
jgi:hypothetical protein